MRPLTKISLFGIRLATLVLIVYWVLLFTGTHLPTLPKISMRVSDKLLHFGAFFGLAMLLCWVIPTRTSPWRKFAVVAAIALVYGAFDEITQGFVRGRTTDIRDFAADALGAFTAIGMYASARWFVLNWFSGLSAVILGTATKPTKGLAKDSEKLTQASELATVAKEARVLQTGLPRAMSADHDSINVA